MKFKNRTNTLTTGIIFLLGILMFSIVSCKSPDSPDADISTNIFVSNECGLAKDVYMDGIFQFSIEFLYYEVIQNVPRGVYHIVTKIKDSEEVVAEDTVDVYVSGEYWVSILSSASLKIINEYGETLNIYTNGSLQGELGHEETQVFDNVPYGEHNLEASKTSDNTLVASTVINVVEAKEYTWTIK